MNPAPPLSSSNEINLRRLVALRLIALTGQSAVVWAVVTKLHMELPLRPLIGVITGMAAISLLTWLLLRRPWPVPDVEIFGQLLLDVVVLTALLYFSGGATNPFVTLYLLPLAITAAALPGPLSLRPPRPGDRLRPLGMQGSVKIADLLSEGRSGTASEDQEHGPLAPQLREPQRSLAQQRQGPESISFLIAA